NFREKAMGFWTPLMYAAQYGQTEAVKLLLAQKKIKVNEKDDFYGYTALINASDKGYAEIVQLLADAKANLNAKDGNEQTPLMLAAKKNSVEVVKILIAKKASVNQKNSKGETALSIATASNATGAVELLKAAGAK
ncbi:MAG TPA: hypothetical protein DDW65_16800, partial [Firmicutes bacterium]|nr:hypothetical protein [Bacillota bacterium]